MIVICFFVCVIFSKVHLDFSEIHVEEVSERFRYNTCAIIPGGEMFHQYSVYSVNNFVGLK